MRIPDSKGYKKPLLWLTGVFIISRIFVYFLGVRFDASGLNTLSQFIDPDLLQHDLLRSIFYLHSQPPLFNLFVGCVIKSFSPVYVATVFHVIYVALGLGLAFSLYTLMAGLQISQRVSFILASVFIVSPSCILYENWLFYTYPMVVLLLTAALLLQKYLKTRSKLYIYLFFTNLSAIALTRSLFHLVWFLLITMILWVILRQDRKTILKAMAFPFFLVFLWYAKNAVVFGSFSASTWLGVNLSRVTVFMLPQAERQALVDQGELSALALIPPFPPLRLYEAAFKVTPRVTGIPVLDMKERAGKVNYNQIEFIEISRIYLDDAITVLAHFPGAYWKGIRRAFCFYFLPSSNYHQLDANRHALGLWNGLYDTLFYGRLINRGGETLQREALKHNSEWLIWDSSLFLVLGLPVLVLLGLVITSRALSIPKGKAEFGLTVLFLWVNIVFVTMAGNSMEIGENNRFRFMIDPFFIILLGLALSEISMRLSKDYFKWSPSWMTSLDNSGANSLKLRINLPFEPSKITYFCRKTRQEVLLCRASATF